MVMGSNLQRKNDWEQNCECVCMGGGNSVLWKKMQEHGGKGVMEDELKSKGRFWGEKQEKKKSKIKRKVRTGI